MGDLFASAKRSLRRGQYHTFDLAMRLNAVNAPDAPVKAYTFVVEPQPDGITEIHKVRFNPAFRDEFPSIIFDAVSNFRACLDQIGYAIAIPRGLPEADYAPLPIGKDIKWIENRINGLKYLPQEIRALYRSFNPYKGGNDTLWALNELCNIKKHAALVPFDAYGLNVALRPRSGTSVKISGSTKGGSTFDPEANEIVVGVFPKGTNTKTDTEVNFAVVLKHAAEIISGQHPIFLLEAIRGEVARVLTDTEAKCREIGLIP